MLLRLVLHLRYSRHQLLLLFFPRAFDKLPRKDLRAFLGQARRAPDLARKIQHRINHMQTIRLSHALQDGFHRDSGGEIPTGGITHERDRDG
jgi:hypothetical protein